MLPVVPTPRRELVTAATAVDVDRELRAQRTVALFRGVHVDAGSSSGRVTRARAAVATQGGNAIVAMQTAAVLLELPWLPEAWRADSATLHLAVPPTATRRHRPGLRLHHRSFGPDDVEWLNGVPCMSVTRTLVELARDPSVPPLLVVQVIDGVLRQKRTSYMALLACLARFPGERGVARARRLVERSREGVDSPTETTMRILLEDGGISGLDVNIEIRDDDGLLLARGDLGVRCLLIWGEYDGYDSHTEQKAFRSDRVGDRWLDRRGWQVMRFVDLDLRRPEQTCREWRQAIADAPARIAALDPTRSPEIAEAHRLLGL